MHLRTSLAAVTATGLLAALVGTAPIGRRVPAVRHR